MSDRNRRPRAATPLNVSRDIIDTFSRLPHVQAGHTKLLLRKPVSLPPSISENIFVSNVSKAAIGADNPPASRLLLGDRSVRAMSDASRQESMPTLADGIDRWIDNELRIGSKTAAHESPDDRLIVFQEAAKQLQACFPSFGSLLGKIFTEYDTYVAWAQKEIRASSQSRSRDANALRECETRLQDTQTRLKAAEAREEARRGNILRESSENDSPAILMERILLLEQKLRAEREHRSNLEVKLGKSTELSADFHRTIRAIEANNDAVLRERDMVIEKLNASIEEQHRQHAAAVQQVRDELSAASDESTVVEIQKRAAETALLLMRERLRHLESRLASGAARYVELQENHAILEARLERLNKPTTTSMARDPAMTPRPSKVAVINLVPQLGSPVAYATTEALIAALVEAHSSAVLRGTNAEAVQDGVAAAVGARLAEVHQKLKDRRDGVCTVDHGTMTVTA